MSYKNKYGSNSSSALAEPIEHVLSKVSQVSHSRRSYKDFLDLDDADLDLIDQVAVEMAGGAGEYLYDEEYSSTPSSSMSNQGPAALHVLDTCRRKFNSEFESTVQSREHQAGEDFKEDDPDADYDLDCKEWAHLSEDDEGMSLDDGDDEDLAIRSESSSEDFELLDDALLSEDGKLNIAIYLDDPGDDYFDFDDEGDDSEVAGRSDLGEIQLTEGLTREERARQLATRVGVSYGWGRSGVELLAEIFEEHGWGPARVAIEQMLAEGISEDELLLVKELKDLWEDNHEYALAFLSPFNRTGYCTYQGGRVLSWRMAAKVTRLFPVSDICEVESFLNAAFDAWYEGPKLKYRFPVFLNFVKHVISGLNPQRCFPGGAFHDEIAAEDFEHESEIDLPRTLLYRELADFGLLPVLESDFLSSVGKARGKRA